MRPRRTSICDPPQKEACADYYGLASRARAGISSGRAPGPLLCFLSGNEIALRVRLLHGQRDLERWKRNGLRALRPRRQTPAPVVLPEKMLDSRLALRDQHVFAQALDLLVVRKFGTAIVGLGRTRQDLHDHGRVRERRLGAGMEAG